jgi:hypothetical protein
MYDRDVGVAAIDLEKHVAVDTRVRSLQPDALRAGTHPRDFNAVVVELAVAKREFRKGRLAELHRLVACIVFEDVTL